MTGRVGTPESVGAQSLPQVAGGPTTLWFGGSLTSHLPRTCLLLHLPSQSDLFLNRILLNAVLCAYEFSQYNITSLRGMPPPPPKSDWKALQPGLTSIPGRSLVYSICST